MANIVLTDVCNLKCPYCFAGEFVNQSKNEISLENFRIAKDFILTGGKGSVGIIGGEPLLHSQFRHILRDLIADRRVRQAVIYTNGVRADEYLDEFGCEKFRFLINCNPPEDMGREQFERLRANLERMVHQRYMKDRITLGINMYKPDFSYGYMLELLEEFDFQNVRVSISVPDCSAAGQGRALADFIAIKPRMLQFFRKLKEKGIAPHYDCNKIPRCCLTDEEAAFCRELFRAERDINKRDVDFVRCNPVIDILQDLTAIRCFGLSRFTKQSILDYRSIDELRAYYHRTVDAFAGNTVHDADCVSCDKRLKDKCYGGCLAYKMEDIQKLQAACDALMQNGYGKGC